MPWATSNRRQQLPPNWATLRKIVARRADGRCQNIIDGTRCPAPGTDCDHIHPGNNHDTSNLQWLCADCHTRKTIRERRPPRHRPQEPHPGSL